MKEKYLFAFKKMAKKGVFPHQFAFTLLIPIRNIFLSPKKLIQRLKLKEHYNVLEVGSGPGYFSSKVAKAVPNGKLILSDIQKEMLDLAKKRLSKKKVFNVEYHLCNGFDFSFEENEFDRIYMVTVLGEIEKKKQYIKEFFRMLRPDGILSISEQAGDPDKMSIEEIKDLLNDSGFEFDRFYGTKNNFTINFRKKNSTDGIELKLDEADLTDIRYIHDEVFSRARAKIMEKNKYLLKFLPKFEEFYTKVEMRKN